jgi:hypothetical protein
MCGSFFGGGGDSKIAKQQRADEVARQARIKAGMAQIARVFDGGTVGVNPATSYDPNATYYNADGSVFAGVPSGGGTPFRGIRDPFGNPAGAAGNPQSYVDSGSLFTGTEQRSGFDDAFFDKRRQDYVDYATPTLDRQAGDAREQMIYALSRTGNLDSSAAIDKASDLTRDTDEARLAIENQGLDLANTARTNVENVRSNLVSELNATGDSAAAAQGALRNAQNLNMPQGFSPLGQMFQAFASGISNIGSNAANDYKGFLGGGKSLFGGSPRGSQRVVG